MKYLGIDYGSKRVGTAISNAEGTIAFPRATLPNTATLVKDLTALAQQENVEQIIVGDTRSHGGGENPVTAEAHAFMQQLAEGSGRTVTPVFEVFSSIEASRYAPGTRQHDDSAAAAVILQRFLDMKGPR